MWLKWFPWKFIVRRLAKRWEFLDPVSIFSQLSRFAQPSEVAVPIELLRAGFVFHARGLMNSRAIQHNLDWIWPYWVSRQFDPHDDSFIPRAFSLTHVNLTHRNWTAVGLPDLDEYPLVDPRGLVTPFFDGWSLDAWIFPSEGEKLIPSRSSDCDQKLNLDGNLSIFTRTRNDSSQLSESVELKPDGNNVLLHINFKASSRNGGWLVVSARPYNTEGVKFIHTIDFDKENSIWTINGDEEIHLSENPDRHFLSDYHQGDVSLYLPDMEEKESIKCDVGMSTSAALYKLESDGEREVNITIPFKVKNKWKKNGEEREADAVSLWESAMSGCCRINIPDERIRFLYDAAVKNLVLFSPGDVFPGPYTYKRFWFRDAAFMLNGMICAGLTQRSLRVLDRFPSRQNAFGFFLSQNGEWDSNGEALWIMDRYVRITGRKLPDKWLASVKKGADWIIRKRLSKKEDSPISGLLPAGFSAEHLGPNDYYYWDDFWAVAGLEAASHIMSDAEDDILREKYGEEAHDMMASISRSLEHATKRLNRPAMPAAPYRRLDAGSIGSVIAGYPLQLMSPDDERLNDTMEYILENCMVEGGFFQDMIHSGINVYLTLHIAQVLLRAGDERFLNLVQTVADLASPTGQWPEAIHSQTKYGCMGDGQHIWAAAEWVMMIRNMFLYEERNDGKLILCSGIPPGWLERGDSISFGPAPTEFGTISIELKTFEDKLKVFWEAQWFENAPGIEIRIPGFIPVTPEKGTDHCMIERKRS